MKPCPCLAVSGRPCDPVPMSMRGDVTVSVEVLQSLSGFSPECWHTWTAGHPLLSWHYWNALHETGCASAATGWEPVYALVKKGDQALGAMPLYLKTHSRGEFVFDQAWASAFHQYGKPYYPKL